MLNGLTHQYPIERVSMQCRKLIQMQYSPFMQRQSTDPVRLTLACDELLDATWERQPSHGMLDREFADGYHTEHDLVGRIDEAISCCGG